MLWTDGELATVDDLSVIDPDVPGVASAENIVVDGENGVLRRTYEQCTAQLMLLMQRFGGYLNSGLVSANHLAAVFNVGGPGVNRTRVLPCQIVAYDPAMPLMKTWFVYAALQRFYHAAFSRTTMNDRYEKKMRQFETDVNFVHWPMLKQIGVPIVYRPLPRPAATLERSFGTTRLGTGTWSNSNLSAVAAAGVTTGGDVDVVVTWVDRTFYRSSTSRYNAESCPSKRATITLEANQVVKVDVSTLEPTSSLNDPAYLSQAIVTPLEANGWNVYAGPKDGVLRLQNESPIAIAQKTYTLAGDPTTTSFVPDFGQYPDAYFIGQDIVQRG